MPSGWPSPASVDDRLRHGRLKLRTHIDVSIRHELNHQDSDHLLFRVDPEVSAIRATPPVFANRTERQRLAQILPHADPESNPVAAISILPQRKLADLIGRHHFDGLAADQPRAIE